MASNAHQIGVPIGARLRPCVLWFGVHSRTNGSGLAHALGVKTRTKREASELHMRTKEVGKEMRDCDSTAFVLVRVLGVNR